MGRLFHYYLSRDLWKEHRNHDEGPVEDCIKCAPVYAAMRYRLAASVGISYMPIVDREPPLSLEEKDKVKNMVFEKIKIVPVVRDHELHRLWLC